MNINLEYYKIFYYVAKLGGITIASEQLCISQPAVSQAIKHMERNLGSNLFIRTPKGVILTKEGQVLYSYVKQGYEFIQLGETNFRKMIDLENGEIRIGASDMTLKFYLLPYLEQFHKQYPTIKVIVTNAPTPETLEYLSSGKIDFGIVSSPIDKKTELSIHKVQEIEDIFVCGNNFLYLKDKVIEYKDLETLPIICLEHNTSTRRYVDEFLEQNLVKLEPEFELATSDMIVQFALRNLGIGCVVKDFALKEIADNELFQINFKNHLPKRHICTVTSTTNPISTAAKKLLDLM